MEGSCTVPKVYPPTILEQYYVIHNTAYTMDIGYASFDFGPIFFKNAPYSYSFDQYSQTAVLTGSGNTPSDPSWATLDGANDKTVISTNNSGNAG